MGVHPKGRRRIFPSLPHLSSLSHGDPYATHLSGASRHGRGSSSGVRLLRARHGAGRYDAAREIIVAANCVIPATQAALERTNRHFRMPAGSGAAGHRLLGGGAYVLEPIVVEACQNGNEWPDCEDEGSSGGGDTYTPPAYSGGGGNGGAPGGPGGEGEGETGDDPEPQEPCNTGDPVIDSPTVQADFDQLWTNSNPEAPLFARTERGGWIVQTSSGYDVVPFTQLRTSYCGMDGSEPYPANGTIIGFVHTHPYAAGETITNCELEITDYRGRPSNIDIKMGLALGRALNRAGALPGYILDGSGIRSFAKEQPTYNYTRCGY